VNPWLHPERQTRSRLASAPTAEDRAKLMAMNGADLETCAAERNVTWDPKASKQTMIGRIVTARAKP
jgi:hypothetical protein